MKGELKSFDPSNGELVGSVATTPVSEIDTIVARAKEAQKSWRKISIEERIKFIQQASKEVNKQSEELTVLLSREMGKDYRRSSGEVSGVAYGAPYMANEAMQALQPEQKRGATIEYDPLGVVAVISPWNYPLMMAVNLMIPALVAGNTVVFKPSEETPLIAQAYVEILNKYLPEHVVQVVYGDREQGQALVDSDIQMIAFTGSQATGRDIMKRAASSVKRLVMELGGNDPMIVMADANLDAAARFAVASSFENAGQMCTSTERIYVDESVADDFEQNVQSIASFYRLGAWNEDNVNIGPIINEKQRTKIMEHIDDAVEKGAKILLGAKDHPDRYIAPTVLSGIKRNMRMEHEETFGPVVSISRYQNLEDAIAMANDSEYGLGAVVFGGAQAKIVAKQLEAGMVGINGGVGAGDAPWVGAKQSGFGYHGSINGHRQFAQLKVISN